MCLFYSNFKCATDFFYSSHNSVSIKVSTLKRYVICCYISLCKIDDSDWPQNIWKHHYIYQPLNHEIMQQDGTELCKAWYCFMMTIFQNQKDQLHIINVGMDNDRFCLASSDRLNIIGRRNASSNVMQIMLLINIQYEFKFWLQKRVTL